MGTIIYDSENKRCKNFIIIIITPGINFVQFIFVIFLISSYTSLNRED